MSQTLPIPAQPQSLQVASPPPDEDWAVLGDTFEAMGKVGLALTVGFAAAALFCRWADQRKLKVPPARELLQHLEQS